MIASKREMHGKTKTKEFNSWRHIRARCNNKNHQNYMQYGGRGINGCQRWDSSFSNFLSDMGEAPSKSHSIDRIDNDKGYYPENCRWASKSVQVRNRGVQQSSKSGVTGVMYHSRVKSWIAVWTELTGKRKSKSFSVKKYGEERAFLLAKDARMSAEKQLRQQLNGGE